jgi:hypothetical protein
MLLYTRPHTPVGALHASPLVQPHGLHLRAGDADLLALLAFVPVKQVKPHGLHLRAGIYSSNIRGRMLLYTRPHTPVHVVPAYSYIVLCVRILLYT